MPRPLPPPEECANCGAAIPRNARACPDCGADERTGWRETSLYDGLNLPESDDPADGNYRERSDGLRWYWVAAIIVVLATLILGALGLRS